jgi:hypothetical protein
MSVVGLVIMISAGAVVVLIAGFVVALLVPPRGAPDRRALGAWEPPPDITWDDVRQLIEEADPVTRLTLERSFPPPPPVVVMRLAPAPRQPAQPGDRDRPAYARALLDTRWERVGDRRPRVDRPCGVSGRSDPGEPPADADRAG